MNTESTRNLFKKTRNILFGPGTNLKPIGKKDAVFELISDAL